ncbi:unnamed protein product [Sphagnum balticum]
MGNGKRTPTSTATTHLQHRETAGRLQRQCNNQSRRAIAESARRRLEKEEEHIPQVRRQFSNRWQRQYNNQSKRAIAEKEQDDRKWKETSENNRNTF